MADLTRAGRGEEPLKESGEDQKANLASEPFEVNGVFTFS